MRQTVRYRRARGGPVDGSTYRNMARDLTKIIEEELHKAGERGVREARQILDAAGTGRMWSRGPISYETKSPWEEGGTGDRSGTGLMRRALDYRIARGDTVNLDVGWPMIYEEYFGYQDVGFSARGLRRPGTNDYVAGMGIMAHLRTFLRGETDKAMDKALKRIADGL